MVYVRYKNLKYFFLCALCLVIGGTAYTVYQNGQEDTMHQHVGAGTSPEGVKENKALNPHFQAVDEKGQPYTIQAASATVQDEDDIIALKNPSYTIDLKTNIQITVRALEGWLDQNHKKLTLEGDVVVTYGPDMTFNMPSVLIDLKEGDAFGKESIQVVGEKMRIEAGAFEIYNRGEKVVLTKRPVLTFDVKGAP